MEKKKMTFWQIFNMSFGFLGIQFGLALQNANVSRILQSFGADVEHLSYFWLAAPVTGMIVQPIIGHYSDRTWCRLGRRRPYFLAGAILASLMLFLMPNSPSLAGLMSPLLIGAGILMIMDASINVAMEPFRALVADKLPSEQRTLGFSMQTSLIGIGAVVGAVLPFVLTNWFGMSNTPAVEGGVAPNVRAAFYIGAAVLSRARDGEEKRRWFSGNIQGLRPYAQDYGAARNGAVLLLVRAVLHVGVHDSGRGRALLRHCGPRLGCLR